MARFVCSMNVSLDGYVDHDRMAPDPEGFRFWIDAVKSTPNTLYGRKVYQYADMPQTWRTLFERKFPDLAKDPGAVLRG